MIYKNKKGRMSLQDFIVGLLLFSIIIFGFALFMGELAVNYDAPFDDDYNDTYNRLTDTVALAQNIEDQVTVNSTVQDVSATTAAFNGALTAIRSMTAGYTMLNDVIEDFTEELGIPKSFATAFIAVFGIIIVFLIIQFIRGGLAISA